MLFNSSTFLVFFIAFFILYWTIFNKRVEVRNWVILIASYVFYGWWDWRFLALIAISTGASWLITNKIQGSLYKPVRKFWLILSIVLNLGLLAFFKYANFFIENFSSLITSIGLQANTETLNIILPVGISFYTFQTLSYNIDVYRGQIKASPNIIAFAAYVSFFPQLVAGPIERATQLLPQFESLKPFNYTTAVSGLKLILLGLLKKVVIADNCSPYVNELFANYPQYSGSELALGAIYFSCQIYGDFSGYSDIAIGLGRLLGFTLMTNFKQPYFSRNIAEFWRRWHISLTTWFRDYVYIPLGGSRKGIKLAIRNTWFIFLVSGLWHGANWTFVAWGALHAIFFMPLLLLNKNRQHLTDIKPERILPSIKEFLQIITTFSLVSLSWIVFRAESITIAKDYISQLFSKSLLTLPQSNRGGITYFFILLIVDWSSRSGKLNTILTNTRLKRWSTYVLAAILIYYYGNFSNQSFIYFQF